MKLKAACTLLLLALVLIDLGDAWRRFRIRKVRFRGVRRIVRRVTRVVKKVGKKAFKVAKKLGKAGYKAWKKYPWVRKIASKVGCAMIGDEKMQSDNDYLSVMMNAANPDYANNALMMGQIPTQDETDIFSDDYNDEDDFDIPVMTEDEWNDLVSEMDRMADELDMYTPDEGVESDDSFEIADQI